MTVRGVTILICGLLCAGSLAGQTTSGPWPVREAPADLQPVISRADLLISAMHDSLLRQLNDKIDQGGAALAVGAAHLDTTELSRRIARGEGIAVGFTSDRLRNPTNKPRPWAAALVAGHVGRRARDVEGFAVDLGDKVGVLRPIVEHHTCASCHGPLARMSPAVRARLAERYPVDRAVDFADGDIRGWYWVEMPKARR